MSVPYQGAGPLVFRPLRDTSKFSDTHLERESPQAARGRERSRRPPAYSRDGLACWLFVRDLGKVQCKVQCKVLSKVPVRSPRLPRLPGRPDHFRGCFSPKKVPGMGKTATIPSAIGQTPVLWQSGLVSGRDSRALRGLRGWVGGPHSSSSRDPDPGVLCPLQKVSLVQRVGRGWCSGVALDGLVDGGAAWEAGPHHLLAPLWGRPRWDSWVDGC